jgi:hypothetical protein
MAPTVVRESMGGSTDVRPPIAKFQIKNILCPIEFSVFSTRSLDYAVNLARHFGSHLYIQHTIEPNYVPLSDRCRHPDTNRASRDPSNADYCWN